MKRIAYIFLIGWWFGGSCILLSPVLALITSTLDDEPYKPHLSKIYSYGKGLVIGVENW